MPYSKEVSFKDLIQDRNKLQAELARYRTIATSHAFRIQKLKNEIKMLNEKLKDKSTENRQSKRVAVSLVADLTTNNKIYSGLIDNISEDGLHLRMTPSKTMPVIPPDKDIHIKVKVAPGTTFHLTCMKKWSYKTPPQCLVKTMGMQIQNPPAAYKNFFKNLP